MFDDKGGCGVRALGDVDGVGLLPQSLGGHADGERLVLDQKETHGAMSPTPEAMPLSFAVHLSPLASPAGCAGSRT